MCPLQSFLIQQAPSNNSASDSDIEICVPHSSQTSCFTLLVTLHFSGLTDQTSTLSEVSTLSNTPALVSSSRIIFMISVASESNENIGRYLLIHFEYHDLPSIPSKPFIFLEPRLMATNLGTLSPLFTPGSHFFRSLER